MESVFTVEVITKVTPDGGVPIKPVLDKMGVWYSLNSKNNVGIEDIVNTMNFPYFGDLVYK